MVMCADPLNIYSFDSVKLFLNFDRTSPKVENILSTPEEEATAVSTTEYMNKLEKNHHFRNFCKKIKKNPI